MTPYAGYSIARLIMYTQSWPANGTHTIKLVARSGSVGLDAFRTLR